MNIYKVKVGSGDFQAVGFIDEETKVKIDDFKGPGTLGFRVSPKALTSIDSNSKLLEEIRAFLPDDGTVMCHISRNANCPDTEFEVLETLTPSDYQIAEVNVEYANLGPARLLYRIKGAESSIFPRLVNLSMAAFLIGEANGENPLEETIRRDVISLCSNILSPNFKLNLIECDILSPKQNQGVVP